jgi:hypothetical protein
MTIIILFIVVVAAVMLGSAATGRLANPTEAEHQRARRTNAGFAKFIVMVIIVMLCLGLLKTAAGAATLNYVCWDHGRARPLSIDDQLKTLTWKGDTYKITETDCEDLGWSAQEPRPLDFCSTSKKRHYYIEQSGKFTRCEKGWTP